MGDYSSPITDTTPNQNHNIIYTKFGQIIQGINTYSIPIGKSGVEAIVFFKIG